MPDLIFSGKYVVQQELAKGGMGVIYKALDRTLNRLVAIKVVHEHFAGDASFTERFIREARAMARLHHENIVTIFSVEEDRGAPFIVMEYFPGIDLRSRIKAHTPLTLRESLDITLQIANALAFAHSQGIVHRDIKPANILVDTRGRVKLTDFGIAAALDEASITSTGQIIGTPEYMSPEQAGGLDVDGRTDLYSLGIVLHEMIAGHTPFRNLPKTGILAKLLDPQYEIPLTVPSEIPSAAKAIVEDLVRRNPEYRTPRAAILAGQLKECLASVPSEENEDVPTIIATTPTHATRPTRLSTMPPPHESQTISSRSSVQSEEHQVPLIPTLPGSPGRMSSDEATDVLPSPRVGSQALLSTPPPGNRRRKHAASIAIAILGGLIGLGGLAYYFAATDRFPSVRPAPPNAEADGSITANGQSKESVPRDDAKAQLAKEQEQLAIDEARVIAKQREAEALQKKENEQAAKQAKIVEEHRKKAEEAARMARQRQEAEQRKFAEDQKRLEKEKELAAAQAQAAEEQRRKAQEEARLARQREESEARRSKEEADMKRLQEERQRLERERELAEERARLAEAQRKKAEEEARLAQVRHEEEQRRLQADQQRIAKENELAAQRAQIQEDARRRAAEEARIERQRLEAEQKRLQAERDRLNKEKEEAAERARLEAEERRKAEEEARVVRQRNEAEQKRLQAERERVEREEAAAQRAKAELEARRKSEEEARAAREAEQRELQAERERLEKEKREAAAQRAKAEEEARKRQAIQEEEQRKKEQLVAKLTPGTQTNPTASRRQLESLLKDFMHAYEDQDFPALKRLSDMSADRLTFLDTIFSRYGSIKVKLERLTVEDQTAFATFKHEALVDKNGDMVLPSPIMRTFKVTIHKAGDQWTRIEW